MAIKKKPKGFEGYHWHHIVPRHMGGTDDNNNLVLLHPLDHAKAHLELYKLYKKPEDAWAYNWLISSYKESGLRISQPPTNFGRKWSNEVNKKKARYGNENAMSRPEIKEKQYNAVKKLVGTGVFANKGNKNPASKALKINDKNYECISDASKFYNVGRDTIRGWLNGIRPQKRYQIKNVSYT